MLGAVGCTAAAERTDHRSAERRHDGKAAGAVVPDTHPQASSSAVRALYVNRWASQSRKRMAKLIATADSTEINALVIDMKDEFGLNYATKNADFAKNAGTASKISNVTALIDTLKAHKILPIARIVVFKDSVTARVHPGMDDSPQRRLDLARQEGHRVGEPVSSRALGLQHRRRRRVGEARLRRDPVRLHSLSRAVSESAQAGLPGLERLSKPEALAAYLKEAKTRLNKLGVRSTADIFGLVTTVNGALEVGQNWEKLSPNVDVVLPMVYPSHYPHGELGVQNPNAEPYNIILKAISRARERDKKLGIKEPEHVRPWLQAFTLGKPVVRRRATDRGAKEGGLRLGVRRLGDVEPGVDLRRLHAGAREDARLAQEDQVDGDHGCRGLRTIVVAITSSFHDRSTPRRSSSPLIARTRSGRSSAAPQTTKRPSSPASPSART